MGEEKKGTCRCLERCVVQLSDPKRPVRPALGTAGLTKAFSGTAEPGCGQAAFQSQSQAWPGSPAGFWYFHPVPNTQK